MKVTEALGIMDSLLNPETTFTFMNGLSEAKWRRIPSNQSPERQLLLGPNPAETLLSAYTIATELTFHSSNATEEAPNLVDVSDAKAFAELVKSFHERHYSVRFPNVRPFSPPVDRVCRALEVLLHKPVTASSFWSQGGMTAPVHSDDHDLLVVQIKGRKRWFVSDETSSLNNTWEQIPEGPVSLGQHTTFDVQPGDMVYLPRGSVHSVEGTEESVHVSIGFTPLTLREALIAVVDHASDIDRGWRVTVAPFLAHHLMSGQLDDLPNALQRATSALSDAINTSGFVASALQRRSSRSISQMVALTKGSEPHLSLTSMVKHSNNALWHLSANPLNIDVAYPGGHIYIHRGAESAVVFMINTTQFKVSEIPGVINDEVRLSLAKRFIEAGLIEPVLS